MTINEFVIDYWPKHPTASNAAIAEAVREAIPGAKTTAESVSSIKSRSGISVARDGTVTPRPVSGKTARAESPAPRARRRSPGNNLPVAVVRATLAEHGIASINVAKEWAAVHGLLPSSIVSIVRGPDVKGARKSVDLELADDIATALGDPALWTTDWAPWSRPAGPPLPHAGAWRAGDEVEHDITGERGRILWAVGRTSALVDFNPDDEDGARIVPMHQLVLVVR